MAIKQLRIIVWILIAAQLSSCATPALWRKTDPSSYIVMSSDVITEEELHKRGAKYIKNEQAAVFYVKKSDFDKFADYTYRTIGTPITVVVDAAIVVLVAYALLGGFQPTRDSEAKSLNDELAKINEIAFMPQGEKAVIDQLTKTFPVTTEQIRVLLDQKIYYGEVAIILALSQTMTGGVTCENINLINDLRKTGTEWVDIANILSVRPQAIRIKLHIVGEKAKKH